MLHRFDPKRAQKVYLLPVIAVLLLAVSIVLFVVGLPLPGVVALGVAAYAGYHLIRYTILQFRSSIRWDEESIVCVSSLGLEVRMEWDQVDLGGEFRTAKGGQYLFVYNDQEDDLLSIPPHYTDIETLQKTIRDRSQKYVSLEGESPEDLATALKPYVQPEG